MLKCADGAVWPVVGTPSANQWARSSGRAAATASAVGWPWNTWGAPQVARLSWVLGLRAGADTILRAVHALPLPAIGEPVVVGIDDWALARGHRYGTIFVDLQQHRPLDLIAGREMTEVRNWLAQHPGIRVVARDRAGAYGQAARQALPQAVQVTDRWHLLNNLSEMAERVLLGCQQALRTATASVNAELRHPNVVVMEPTQTPSTPGPTPVATTRREQRRALRLDRFEEVRRRHGQAQALRSIARDMGLSANTVRKFVRADGFPESARRATSRSMLDPWREHLESRWMEGCSNTAELWREIQAKGYRGGASQVRLMFSLRRPMPPADACPIPSSPPGTHRTTPSARRVRARLFGRTWASKQDTAQARLWWRRYLDELCRVAPDVEKVRRLGRQFIDIVRQQSAQALSGWLEQAQASGVEPLQRFASGIEADRDAVIAALSTPWSSGQVEGQINRLKYLKRQMYGRAGMDLLRIRVLYRG